MLTETPGSRFRHLQPLGALERAFFIYTTTSFASARPLYQRLMHLVKEYETALRTSSGATGISRSIRTCRCPTHGYRSLGKRKPPLRAQPTSYPTAPAVVALRGKDLRESVSNF